MKFTPTKITLVLSLLMASYSIPVPGWVTTANAQTEEVEAADKAKQQEDAPPEDDKNTDSLNVTDTALLKTEQIGDNFIRFHMWDGTVISGEIQVDSISVKTKFGTLEIPVREINRFHPGLDSFPELHQRIRDLVEKLGDKDFDIREKSHRALAEMGTQLRNEIGNFDDGGSAERKKRLAEIRKEIDESLDEMDDDGTTNHLGLIRGDRIETSDFSIVGKILQEEFSLTTKFGQLKLRLNDIKMGDRSFRNSRSEIQKTVTVDGEVFFQRTPLSTKIRVNRGDVIKIRASGTVQWTNWNTSSSPDGLTNQGQYMGIMSGTLTARVGNSGKLIKIGSKGEFVAEKSGVLFLAIAIQDNFANRKTGYRWTGNYKTKINVQPANQ